VPPPACTDEAPNACDDGDACTDDVCSEGRCLNLPADGMRAVRCPLDVIAQELRDAAPEDVGGPKARTRMLARIAGIARAVDAGDGPRGRASLKRAAKQLGIFIRGVERGIQRGTVRADLGYGIAAHARRAATQLATLVPLSRGR
jgi:hypothetical protein